MIEGLLLLSAAFVAFTNGANANSKGVASLYGTGTASLRTALLWGTAATFLGSLSALLLSSGMLKSFSGQGLVDAELLKTPDFLAAVASGAAVTSFLATRFSFPVSTTHALLGALLGAGVVGNPRGVHPAALWDRFLVPLLFSPLLALALGAALYALLSILRLAPSQRGPGLDAVHVCSTGAASFARGLNDTPKMAALLAVVPWLDPSTAILAVAVLVACGGLVDSRNVGETLGKKITRMSAGQGFASSLVTAGLVATASLHSLPVSTTHVSVGSLTGIGAVTGQANWRTVAEILLAWIVTVPCGAAVAALVALLLARL